MTPNSEQVKAIADEVRRIKFAFDKGDYRIDALEKLALRVEALSTQPTVTASAEEPAEALYDDHAKIRIANEEGDSDDFYMDLFGFKDALSEATAELRRELEEKTVTNGQMSEIINNCERIIRERNAQVSDLTAEVERLKRELYQRYVSWMTELGHEVEAYEEWKASRGKR